MPRIFTAYSFLLACLALTPSCRFWSPGGRVLEPSAFAPVYGSLAETAFRARKANADSATTAHQVDSVLARYGVTRKDVQASMAWYNGDVRRWKPFLDTLLVTLDVDAKRESAGP